MSMGIRVFGKVGCGKCDSCKKNLGRLGLLFESIDITEWLDGSPPGNWQERNLHNVLAAYYHLEDLPLLQINDEEITSYPAGMRRIKMMLKEATQEVVAVA